MGIFPVAMSLTVTFLSALTLLGNPVEVYNFDTMFWWMVLGTLLAVAASAHVFIPFFFRLRITTVFEVSIKNSNMTTTSVIIRTIIITKATMMIIMMMKMTMMIIIVIIMYCTLLTHSTMP